MTREECDRLTRIIKSRVVDSPIIRGTEDRRPSEVPVTTADNGIVILGTQKFTCQDVYLADCFSDDSDVDTPDLCNTAVKEAKKWFEGKKLGPNSKPLECGICTLNSAPHVSNPFTFI